MNNKEFWVGLKIGNCEKCGKAHSLINGLCWDCRPGVKRAEPCDILPYNPIHDEVYF